MRIEKDTIITLDDNLRYFVAAIKEIDNSRYILIGEESNPTNIKVCEEKQENELTKLTVIEDQEQKLYLLSEFMKDIANELEVNE